jgi:hypothetical protein
MTQATSRGRFVVDPWDPGYAGVAEAGIANTLEESAAPLDLELEMPTEDWAPIPPSGDPASLVHFIDGVRRIDARVWFTDGPTTRPGIAASYAAGVATCDGAARIAHLSVERAVFAATPAATSVRTPNGGIYVSYRTANDDIETLTAAMQARMRLLEIAAAGAARQSQREDSGDLLVIDGPLRGRENLPRAIGYIKTHQAAYLPPAQVPVVEALSAGQRTPIFTVGSHWIRHTWYLRLPGPMAHPWAGVVRCECSADLTPTAAVRLADVSAATLPKYASDAHKDGRAPQNLYPIAGLERHLRHRLGERDFVYRQLRQATPIA